MPLIEPIAEPNDRQLRIFGLICGLLMLGVAWFLNLEIFPRAAIGVTAFLVLVFSVMKPSGLRPIFIVFSKLTAPIGSVIGEVLLLIVFAFGFVPIGLLLRIWRRDALKLRFSRTADTYWQQKRKPRDAASYFRQS